MATEAPALGKATEAQARGGRWGSLSLLSLTILSGVAMQNSISPVQEAMKLLEQNPVRRVPRPAPIDRVSKPRANRDDRR